MDSLQKLASTNLAALTINPYPGRIIVVGMDETGEDLIQICCIMGRSPNSRNRVYTRGHDGLLFTEAADPSKVEDPSLIFYDAMREVQHESITYAVVSNGRQTDDVAEGYAEDKSLHVSMLQHIYEPDKPNFTPRITASCYWRHRSHGGSPIAKMSILRKSPFGDECDPSLHEINGFKPGFGYCISTYSGDGDPLPSFRGDPYLLPLRGDISELALFYWAALDTENKVSLAVKSIPKGGGPSRIVIINKYKKV